MRFKINAAKAKVIVAKDFSAAPIGRYRDDSEKSGEAFREDILYPKISETIEQHGVLIIDFTGMRGLSASFLEEAFGGLVRNGLSADAVLGALDFKTEKKLL